MPPTIEIDVPAGATKVSLEITPTFAVPPPSPPPPPVTPPPPAPALTVILRGELGVLVDGAGVSWSLVAGVRNGSLSRAGVDQTITANATRMELIDGVIHHSNDAGVQYRAGALTGAQVAWTRVVAAPVPPPPAPAAGAPPGFPVLAWSSDFAAGIDPAKWRVPPEFVQHGTRFKPANVAVVDGALQLTGKVVPGATPRWEGGWIERARADNDHAADRSVGHNALTHYWECRARIVNPTPNWNAAPLWVYGGNPDAAHAGQSQFGEFDILELITKAGRQGNPMFSSHSIGNHWNIHGLVDDVDQWKVWGGTLAGNVARGFVTGADGVRKQYAERALNAAEVAVYAANPQFIQACLYSSSWVGDATAGTALQIQWFKVWRAA